MKKIAFIIASILLLSTSAYYAVANYNVVVSAFVASPNHAPIVLSVNPSDDPRLLRTDRIQHYVIYYKDDEKNPTTFSITSGSGYVTPGNGSVATAAYDTNSGAYINFTFASPSVVPALHTAKITVAINDGTNVTTKDLNVYVY